MEVLILQVFVSLMLVAGSVLLFAISIRGRDYEHADRLALFPIANDDATPQPPKQEQALEEETDVSDH